LTVPDDNPTKVVPSGPNSVPPDPTPTTTAGVTGPGLFGVSTFLEQPPPTPNHRAEPGAGEVLGPSTTNHETHRTLACEHPSRQHPVKLLRKEVIQPHLPVRLPCYDFVPIASPTFDRSPPCGLGHGLRVLPTFVT
jgi:hypothetical protein